MYRTLGRLLASLTMMMLIVSIAAATQVGYGKFAFRDEFNMPAGTPVDTGKWTAETGGGGWGNQELQYYTGDTENAYHDGTGSLIIKTIKRDLPPSFVCWYGQCRYTSARLVTKGKFDRKYGRFEARIKIARGQGIWPAFWMLGNNIDTAGWPSCGEIDVMENIGREPNTVHGTIHGPGYSGANGIGAPFSLPNNPVFADEFHIYSAEWTQNKVAFYIDGNLTRSITPKNLPAGTRWVFDHPFFMILNLAVGGPWGGEPDSTTVFPQTMSVDYVRVYRL